MRQDLAEVAQIESATVISTSSFAKVAVVADGDLEFGLGCFHSGPGFLERLVLRQSFDQARALLDDSLDAGAGLFYLALESVDLVDLLKVNLASPASRTLGISTVRMTPPVHLQYRTLPFRC